MEEVEVGELNLPLPVNREPIPRFANMVRFFNNLAGIQGKGAAQLIQQTIIGFIASWKKQIGNDLLPAIRLWFPQEDDQLKQLGRIKDAAVGKLIAEALDLSPKSASALALSNVKRGNYGMAHITGEDGLAMRAKRAIDERFPIRDYSQWKIDEVAVELEKFIAAKKEDRRAIMKRFLETMNSVEFYWLVKIIQCNLAVRCSERSFLRAFHPNAEQVYMVNKSLQTACKQLWSTEFSVTEADKSVRPLSFFCPMLAKYIKGVSIDFKSVAKIINTASFYIEEKIDGERVQLHWIRESETTRFLSRRSTDHTDSYQGIFSSWETADAQPVTMADLVDDSVESVILDGEVVAWNPETNDFCGQSKVRELTHYVQNGKYTNLKGRYKHMMFVFDIVYLNGEVLTEEPLKLRKERLKQVLTKPHTGRGRIQNLPFRVGSSPDDIKQEFERILSEMSEGLVVKNPQSQYSLNSRNNNWIKVKPEYVDGYGGETLDLVIVGAYKGSGRLLNKFGSYLVALRDERQKNSRFVPISKVGSGICAAMHVCIYDQIDNLRFSSREVPDWLDMHTMTNARPDFYIAPEHSLVIEVKYSEIIAPDRNYGYGVGFRLRFPRYVKIREDKSSSDATSIGEFLEIQGRRYERAASAEKKRSHQREGRKAGNSLSKRVKAERQETVEQKSHIFDGCTFYLCGDIEDPEYFSEKELRKLVMENGGSVTIHAELGMYPISDRHLPRATALGLSKQQIYHPCWIFDSITAERLLDPEPMHFFLGQPKGRGDLVDQYGFSMYREQPASELKRLVHKMDIAQLEFTDNELAQAQQVWEQFAGGLRLFLFIHKIFYIDTEVSQKPLIKSLLEYGSGLITDNRIGATHIISDVLTSVEDAEVVSTQWVFDCWNTCKIPIKTEL